MGSSLHEPVLEQQHPFLSLPFEVLRLLDAEHDLHAVCRQLRDVIYSGAVWIRAHIAGVSPGLKLLDRQLRTRRRKFKLHLIFNGQKAGIQAFLQAAYIAAADGVPWEAVRTLTWTQVCTCMLQHLASMVLMPMPMLSCRVLHHECPPQLCRCFITAHAHAPVLACAFTNACARKSCL
jgi:hypothetical protein